MKKSPSELSKILLFSKSSKAVGVLFTEILIGISAVLGCLFIFLELADKILDKEAFSFDASIIHFVYSFRSPFATDIMLWFTFLGSASFLGIAILVIIALLYRKHKKDALAFSFIFFLGVILNIILKDLFQRPRPNLHPLVHESSYSFPSGHSMNSFVFYMALSYFIFLSMKNKTLGRILIVLSIILVLCIGLSRIYLGAHYPSDVLAGFIAGLFWFAIVLLFEKTILFLNLFKKYEAEKKY